MATAVIQLSRKLADTLLARVAAGIDTYLDF